MRLRDYSVANTYSSCFLAEIGDLDAAAMSLVKADLALSVYVADGNTYWRIGNDVASGLAKLVMREHENHATLEFPEGLEGLPRLGVQIALMHRFSERKVLTSIDGPHHQYLRAQLAPFLVGFGEQDLLVYAELKLYKVGVFTLTLTIDTPEEGIDTSQLIERYVNLFARWADRMMVPTGVAILGTASELLVNHKERNDREAALGAAIIQREVAKRASDSIKVGDTVLSYFPTHLPNDEIIAELLQGVTPAQPAPSPPPGTAAAKSHAGTVGEAVATPAEGNPHEAPSESDADDGNEEHSPSFTISDIFENLAFATQVALDPPRDGKDYVRHGPASVRLERGMHWQARPFVTITKFDDQPTTATEIRARHGNELGSIMGRVARAPERVIATLMTDSLRLFEDHSFHVNSALSLCVFAARRPGSPREFPEFCSAFDVACAVEMMDYYPARVGQLAEMLSRAKTMKRVRDIRADLGGVEATSRIVFRSGELRDAMKFGWESLGVPALMAEAREKMSLQVEVLAEEATNRSGAQNMTLTVVFGILGAAGIADTVVRPIWEAFFRSPSASWSGPFFFALTATVLGVLLWGVASVARRR